LAGQPNVGKTTFFNLLTGLNQHVGNWPGKTVEQKSGDFSFGEKSIHLVDLPGSYSLTANSEEERVARNFILSERPDVVIVILNAAALERNLYLVAELLSLPQPIVIGLNMMDVAAQKGITIEPHVLEAALGVPVIKLVSTKNQGVSELVEAAIQIALHPETFQPNRPEILADHLPILKEIHRIIAGQVPDPYSEDWFALKLLEGDNEIIESVQHKMPQCWEKIHPILIDHEDAYLDITGGRYEWIARMIRAAVVRPKTGIITWTDRIDRVATHPFWGLLLLLAVFGFIFWITYAISTPLVDLLDGLVHGWLSEILRAAMASSPSWFSGLIIDGLVAGAGTVLTFLPILVIFFAVLALLEDVGYLVRAAYVMDRYMHWMGLHGKSFLPLFLGFGCNVPAIIGTRIIEDRRSRLLTILLVPFIPCTARLAVITFLTPAFFGRSAPLVTFGLVAIPIIILAVIGILIHKFVYKNEHTAFIMEIPLYHAPNLRTIGLYIWNHTLEFIKKAGTVIVIFSGIIWALMTLPNGNMESSIIASFGRALVPVGSWMGLADWRLIVSLFTSFVAKENTIATLGILFAANDSAAGLADRVASVLTPAAALAFLVFQLLFIPCVATIASIRQEAGSKWAFLSVTLMLLVSLGGGILTYQLFSTIL
jgi:ferrous iron transport protein B